VELSGLAARLPTPVKRVARRPLVRYRARGMRADDVLLISYPKSGSTWLRFLLAHALTSIEADFDSIRTTIPPLGRQDHAPLIVPGGRRLIRSHEPIGPTSREKTIVYLVRDARPVALSYLAHEQRYARFRGSVVEFIERFLRGYVGSYGAWHEHVQSALAIEQREGRGTPFLRVRYEDLRDDTVSELARVLRFLGTEPDAAMLADVVAANSKDRMRAKEAQSAFLGSMKTDGSPFVRHDRSLGWSDLVPEEARSRLERVCGPARRAAGYLPATNPESPRASS
jgi:hypothetical protein